MKVELKINSRKYKYKLRTEILTRNLAKYLLMLLNLIAIFIAVKTMDAQIITKITPNFIKSTLYKFNNDNAVWQSLAIGFLISSYFYYIVVYIPEIRRQKDLASVLHKKMESLVVGIGRRYVDIREKSNNEIALEDLTTESFKSICLSVDPNKKSNYIKEYKQNGNTEFYHFGYRCWVEWNAANNNIEYILFNTPTTDSGLIMRIHRLNNCYFSFNRDALLNSQGYSERSLKICEWQLWELFELISDIRKYYLLQYKKDFMHDPFIKQED